MRGNHLGSLSYSKIDKVPGCHYHSRSSPRRTFVLARATGSHEPRQGSKLTPRQGMNLGRSALMTEVLARLSSRAIAGGLGVLLLIACSSGGGSNNQTASSTDVTVWTAWGGNELAAFQKVLKPFHDQTGITVHLTTVRDANQLSINVDAGTSLPDIAPGPTVDKVKDWATKGTMKPVETALGSSFNDYITNTYPALTTVPTGGGERPDRQHHHAAVWRQGLHRLDPGQGEVQLGPDQARVPDLPEGSLDPERVRRTQHCSVDRVPEGRQAALRGQAGMPVPGAGDLHPELLPRGLSKPQGRRRLRLLRTPQRRLAVRRERQRLLRPVRDVQRHARGAQADAVHGDVPRAADLGGRRRHADPHQDHQVQRPGVQSRGRGRQQRQEPARDRRGLHALGHAGCVLEIPAQRHQESVKPRFRAGKARPGTSRRVQDQLATRFVFDRPGRAHPPPLPMTVRRR